MSENKYNNTVNINNRKAKFDYEFLDTFVAGIVLTGTEIKSLREGKASLVDTFCYVSPKGEVWLKNSYIAKYKDGTYLNHEERRERKLLLTKKQIKKLQEESKNPRMTIVPVKMFIDAETKGRCKVLIALARGKKEYDKRETLKKTDANREIDRALKRFK